MKKNKTTFLTVCAAVAAIVSSGFGLFYTFGGERRMVQNIYGESVILFGDGIYANDSMLKAGAVKGTDIGIIIVATLLIMTVAVLDKKRFAIFLRCGLLSILLYASTCLAMGVNFNRLFPLYVFQFACSLFAFIGNMKVILHQKSFDVKMYDIRATGTGIFLIVGGCSTLIWLMFIVPAIFAGEPMEIIEIYTTEPTFVIDLGIILPAAIWCGMALIFKKPEAYQIAPVLLTLLSGVGAIVIFQTIMQSSLGIQLELGQLFGLVISFVILGGFALALNVRFLRHVEDNNKSSS